MALVCCSGASELILGFHRPIARAQTPGITVLNVGTKLPPTPLNLRFKNAIISQARPKLSAVFASNTSQSGGESLEKKSDEGKTSDAAQGPPFLTVLAGFLVFFLVCWILGSIVMGLVGLIVNLPPSK
ncbi:hypothetical protein L1049_011900 [Liquidambar formosana]|uniref:Uncharacterized protein n=1 Tax=Liquidambar formosana TaxID=63359 RepID=A0AAP0RS89_LIQFO